MSLRHSLAAGVAVALLAAGCGGGGDAPAGAAAGRMTIQKGGDCTGSCTGGGGTPVPGATNPLPTTAPAPGILVRESFGPGPEGLRPKSGKGEMRSTFIGTTLGGFWVEWPGSKNTAWITPSGEATWKFTSSVSGNDPIGNPYELPSPLEVDGMRGQVWADVSDGAVSGWPAALLPVTLPSARWAMSIETLPGYAVGSQVGLGLTDSGATLNNLATAAKVMLLLRNDGTALTWELWQGGGAARVLLATGSTDDATWNRIELVYDPQAQLLTSHVNGVTAGPFPLALPGARYAAFEGSGMVDDFVLRTLP